MPHISMQINQDGKAIDLNDETVFPKNAEGKVLITLASLDERALFDLEGALAERNRERILEGKPKYENIQEMKDFLPDSLKPHLDAIENAQWNTFN